MAPSCSKSHDALVGQNVDVEDGAAHGDRCVRRADLVGLLRGDAGDKAERALGQVEDDRARFLVAVVDELVEHHAGARAEGELGVVVEAELAPPVVADLDDLVLAHDVADLPEAKGTCPSSARQRARDSSFSIDNSPMCRLAVSSSAWTGSSSSRSFRATSIRRAQPLAPLLQPGYSLTPSSRERASSDSPRSTRSTTSRLRRALQRCPGPSGRPERGRRVRHCARPSGSLRGGHADHFPHPHPRPRRPRFVLVASHKVGFEQNGASSATATKAGTSSAQPPARPRRPALCEPVQAPDATALLPCAQAGYCQGVQRWSYSTI